MPLPATTTLTARLDRVRASFPKHGIDAMVIGHPPNLRYLTNHVGTAGIAVVTNDAVHLLLDFRYRTALDILQHSPAACPGLVVHDVPGSYDEALAQCLLAGGVRAVGVEAAHMTVARHEWLRRTLGAPQSGIALVSTQRVVESGRVVKDAGEVETLRRAASGLTRVADAAFGAVRAGVTERAVAGVIEAALRTEGFERPAFDPIVASGPNGALPHHRAGERRLADGDLVVLDFGGVLDGYCSDLTRTVSVGVPSSDARRVYGAVHDAQQAARAAVGPGVATSAVDAAARQVLAARGLGDAFGHGTGHGLGLEVHEEPRVARATAESPGVLLEPGMVITIEPGAYLAGWGGVRIEDDVLVTATGCDTLTSVARDLRTCGAG